MEQFEHHIPKLLVTDKALFEIDEDMYLPENLYKEKIQVLHSKILDISSYLEAKEKEPALARLLSEIMTTRPAQPVREMELLKDLQRYESIIQYFEQKNINNHSIAELKKIVSDLKDTIVTFSQLETVAKHRPELN